MFGSGKTLMHLVFIDDLVSGMIQSVERDRGRGKTLILAGEEFCSLNRLTELVADSMNSPPPMLRLPLWPLLTAAYLCESICRPLGWEPALHQRRAAFFTKNRAFSIARAKRVNRLSAASGSGRGAAPNGRLVCGSGAALMGPAECRCS